MNSNAIQDTKIPEIFDSDEKSGHLLGAVATAWYGDLQSACSLVGREACVNCCVMYVWLVDLVRCCVFLMCAFYIVSVECSIKKNDVGLRRYRSCVHIVT